MCRFVSLRDWHVFDVLCDWHVQVSVWSLGSFRLKGVAEPVKIVQVCVTEKCDWHV
jgi:hypothetical protein